MASTNASSTAGAGSTKWTPPMINITVAPLVAVSMFIVNKVFDPVADFVGYPCDRKRHMEEEETAVLRMLALKRDLLKTDPSPSTYQAEAWLQRADKLEEDHKTNSEAFKHAGFYQQCRLAREAVKDLTKRADDLCTQFKDIMVEAKPNLQPIKGSHWQDPLHMPERYSKEVTRFIQDRTHGSSCLGIWGMAGVGKTLLLRQYAKTSYISRYKLKKMFIDAGPDCTVLQVQKAIFGQLGLAVAADVTESALGFGICNRLSDTNFLLVIDNLCAPIDLGKVGIPQYSSVRIHKVVITAHRQSICASMGCDVMLNMQVPDEKEAIRIFNRAARIDILQDKMIFATAMQIIDEVGRVPEALYKVGRVLSIKHHPHEWQHTLKLIRQCNFSMLTNEEDDFLDRLRRGIDILDEKLKQCFLVCSLWKANEEIPVYLLIIWWRALSIVDDFEDGFAYVRSLQYFSLLEKCLNEDGHVRLNGMMQKIAAKILRERNVNWVSNSQWRPSLTQESWSTATMVWAMPKDLDVLQRAEKIESKLTGLICRCQINLAGFKFDVITFLDMQGIELGDFPEEICSMVTLEYLNLSDTKLSQVPSKLSLVSKLKHLILRNNEHLGVLPSGLVKGFKFLKELDMFCSGLVYVLPEPFEDELHASVIDRLLLGITAHSTNVLKRLADLSGQCVSLLSMCLDNFDSEDINLYLLRSSTELQVLYVKNSDAEKLVIEPEAVEEAGPVTVFDSLHTVELDSLPKLKQVHLHMTGASLRTVTVTRVCNLVDIRWIERLPVLENLKVSGCSMMKYLIFTNEQTASMPRLSMLQLEDLPELVGLSNIALCMDRLQYCSVHACDKLQIVSTERRGPIISLRCDQQFWQNVVAERKQSWFSRLD